MTPAETALATMLPLIEAMARRIQALEQAMAPPPTIGAKPKRNPVGVSDAQMDLARRMRSEGQMSSSILASLNAVPGGRVLPNAKAVENLVRMAKMPLGSRTKPDTSVGQVGQSPAAQTIAAQGHAAGQTGTQSPARAPEAGPAAAPAPVAAPHAPARCPAPPNGEARWIHCVQYCRHFDLPPFDGDMLRLNRHLEKHGKKPWVLVEPFASATRPQHETGMRERERGDG